VTRAWIDGGGWFDVDRAERWDEGTRWDGNNHVSLVTGCQWEHERLYRSAKGAWIVYRWSQWQGSRDSYRTIEPAEACDWFVRNGLDVPSDLAELAQETER